MMETLVNTSKQNHPTGDPGKKYIIESRIERWVLIPPFVLTLVGVVLILAEHRDAYRVNLAYAALVVIVSGVVLNFLGRPYIQFNEGGFVFSRDFNTCSVPYSRIERIGQARVSGVSCITIHVRDVEDFIRSLGPIARELTRWHLQKFGAPLFIWCPGNPNLPLVLDEFKHHSTDQTAQHNQ